MTNCFKFLTLVGMLISLQVHMLYAAKAKAKDYDVKICWNNYDFGRVLDTVCDHGARKRSIKREDLVKSELEAKNFLAKLSRRQLNFVAAAREEQETNYHEECCVEGCKVEEILEYCGHSY